MLKAGDRIALVCCSDGLPEQDRVKITELEETLKSLGLRPEESSFLYQINSVFSGTGKERGREVMRFYRDRGIHAIFDVSGGDLANGILEYLNFEEIRNSGKTFYGYSDLTSVLNAIYTETGTASGLYQILNLNGRDKERQRQSFTSLIMGCEGIDRFQYSFLRGGTMEGIVVGGNMRCFLKLAGTRYMPDFSGKLLFLESNGGKVARIAAMITQLKQMGAFEKVSGILLGTFTEMERIGAAPDVKEMILEAAGKNIPVAATSQIGHGSDSRCLMIGEKLSL